MLSSGVQLSSGKATLGITVVNSALGFFSGDFIPPLLGFKFPLSRTALSPKKWSFGAGSWTFPEGDDGGCCILLVLMVWMQQLSIPSLSFPSHPKPALLHEAIWIDAVSQDRAPWAGAVKPLGFTSSLETFPWHGDNSSANA